MLVELVFALSMLQAGVLFERFRGFDAGVRDPQSEMPIVPEVDHSALFNQYPFQHEIGDWTAKFLSEATSQFGKLESLVSDGLQTVAASTEQLGKTALEITQSWLKIPFLTKKTAPGTPTSGSDKLQSSNEDGLDQPSTPTGNGWFSAKAADWLKSLRNLYNTAEKKQSSEPISGEEGAAVKRVNRLLQNSLHTVISGGEEVGRMTLEVAKSLLDDLRSKVSGKSQVDVPAETKESPVNQHKGMQHPANVIDRFRSALRFLFVSNEIPIERLLYAYIDRFVSSPAEQSNHNGALVLRLCGPRGTGKSTIACLLAHATYTDLSGLELVEKCSEEAKDKNTEFLISHSFKKDGAAVSDMLEVVRDVNKRLETRGKDGVVVILNNYNLAEQNVWKIAPRFVQQSTMRNSIVIITDDLTNAGDTSEVSPLNVRLSFGTSASEAVEMIVEETRRVFPNEYLELSSNNGDVWVPFLPLPEEAVVRLLDRICSDINHELRSTIRNYHGRLICDAKSKTQVSMKLASCVQDHGAPVLKTFSEALRANLQRRTFCGEGRTDIHDCVSWKGIPMLSILLEVHSDEDLLSHSESDCAADQMQRWIRLKLLNTVDDS